MVCSSQTWNFTRRRRKVLSPLWRSPSRAHRRGARPDPYGHRAMALARIYGLYPTTDLILQCGRIGKNDPATLVSTSLSNLLSAKPIKSPSPHITWPRRHLMVRVKAFADHPTKPPSDGPSTSPSYFQTKIPSTSPKWGPLKISNQKPEPIAELRSINIFQPNIPPQHRVRFRLKISHTNSIGLPDLTPIGDF